MGLKVGANEYLTKPVDRTLLLEKITSLLTKG
jgi:DNA-binding response OmpR family regulator